MSYQVKRRKILKNGRTVFYRETHWKWVKYNSPQKKYKPHGTGMQMWSNRFGYLHLYTSKERKLLRCPSGYTFGQGMGKLYKVWSGYKRALKRASIPQMERYAKAIQETQQDMGLKTTSFPHLGIYGDQLTLYDHTKPGKEILTYADHSELKLKQQMEQEKEKLKEIIPKLEAELPPIPLEAELPPIPLVPDIEKGEELITFEDKIPQPKNYRIRHSNRMHHSKKKDYEYTCELCDEIVPPFKNHICKPKEKEGDVITFSDEIPFMDR